MNNSNQYAIMEMKNIASDVRKVLDEKYGDYLAGKCVEATEMISELLQKQGYFVRLVEGWAIYDFFETCSSRPYDPHTWLEVSLDNEVYLVDVTLDQFQPFIEEEIEKVIVTNKHIRFLQTTEPDEQQLEEIGW